MAICTVCTKKTGMDLRFNMTTHAGRICVGKTRSMAVQAERLGVSSFQGEDGGMVEGRHTVHPIVALQALRVKFGLVLLHELGCLPGMAIQTGRESRPVQ